jgi:hypothetical protein
MWSHGKKYVCKCNGALKGLRDPFKRYFFALFDIFAALKGLIC